MKVLFNCSKWGPTPGWSSNKDTQRKRKYRLRYSIDIQKTQSYNMPHPKLYPNNCWRDSKKKLNKKTSPLPHFGAFELIITIPLGVKIPRHLFFGVPGVASSGGMERFFKASKVGVGIPQWSPLIRTTPSSSEKPMAKVEVRSFQRCTHLRHRDF